MLRSIRWRLVMGAVLLTLLTVSAVGVVALLLMQRYMVQQERAYLAANAQAIAQQAVSFMTPMQASPRQASPPLQQLAQTAAFLGDVTVRIVDSTQMPLADSAVAIPYTETVGMAASPIYFLVDPFAYPAGVAQPTMPDLYWTTETNQFTVASSAPITASMTEAIPAKMPGVMIEAVPAEASVGMGGTWTKAIPAAAPGEAHAANVIVVQKSPSIWGDRLIFDATANPISRTVSVVYANEQRATDSVGAIATYGEDVTVAATLADATKWQIEKGETGVSWQKAMAVSRSTMAQPTFLQSTGFEAVDVVTAPIHAEGRVVGFVELARATNMVDEPLGAIRRALAIAGGASALLAIAVGLVMSRTLTAPIQNLAEAAAAMSSGDLTARAPAMRRD